MGQKHTKISIDEANAQVVIDTVENVTDVIEANKALYAMTDERAPFQGKSALGTHVASIPRTIYMQLMREGILDDEDRFKAWLNDPANRFMRTRPGKV